jgi:hypothetical protein
MKSILKIANSLAARLWGKEYSHDVLPPEKVRALATSLPIVRHAMIQFSRDEFDRNPYYASVINNLASHTIGPYPSIIGLSKYTEYNDALEDAHLDWMRDNGIGHVYREIRKQAALTGLGIGIPFKKTNTINPIGLSYKIYGADQLKTPITARPGDRIFDGIEYDKDWEPYKFHLVDLDHQLTVNGYQYNDTKEYTVDEVLHWSRGYENGLLVALPECLAAFQIYPFIRRFLQAAIEGEEMKASYPMALEVDANVYTSFDKSVVPYGTFEYEPRTIKTLPPGTKLAGMPKGMSSTEQTKLIRLFASTCALTVNMPANIALGDSSDSNMASAQVDIQPWANKVAIDRFDMEPMFRKSFKEWYTVALLREGVFQQRSLMARAFPSMFPHMYVYTDIHSHPDPLKRASARAVDLASGATTLNRIYSQLGLNARREHARDAELLGMTMEQYYQHVLVTRSNRSIDLILEKTQQMEQMNANQQ